MEEKLLKKIIEIPSFFEIRNNNINNEKRVADFVFSYFQQNFKKFTISKIKVEEDRYNLLILPKSPKIIFCCHLDTVFPSKKNHTKLSVRGDKAYGLGTKDMKGGWVSSILSVLESHIEFQEKVGFLFYCDEEYDQKGMEVMLKNSKKIPKTVKYLISPESRFNLTYGCRGYAVTKVIIYGKKSHTSRPHQGINAGELLFDIYNKLKVDFASIKSLKLGKTSVTLTGLKVGTFSDNNISTTQSSSVPDYAEGVFSIRLSKPTTKEKLIKEFKDRIDKSGAINHKISIEQLRNPSKLATAKDLQIFLQSAKQIGYTLQLADPGLAGYNDVAMLSFKLNIPFFGFGPYGEGNHGPDEWVSLKSIKETKEVFKEFIKNL